MTVTGNTLGLDASTDAAPGDNNGIGTFIADPGAFGAEQDGSYPIGTTDDWQKNGSRAFLDVPSDAPIVRAQLVWACSYQVSGLPANPAPTTPATVTLRLPDGTSHVVAPAGEVTDLTLASDSYKYYQRWADVTSLVAQGGPGACTLTRVLGVQRPDSSFLTACGWTLFTVYQDETEPVRAFNIWMTAETVCFTGAGCPQERLGTTKVDR